MALTKVGKQGVAKEVIKEEHSNVIAELERLNINKTTPLAALNLIEKWQSVLANPNQPAQGSLFDSIN